MAYRAINNQHVAGIMYGAAYGILANGVAYNSAIYAEHATVAAITAPSGGALLRRHAVWQA